MLRIGSGKADITPPVGLPLSGFAVRQNRPSTAIDDPLFVKALVLEWDGAACLLLSFDLLGLDSALDREIRAVLGDAFGARFSAEHILITTTHTHSGPPTMPIAGETRVPDEYIRRLCAATRDAVSQALDRLAEAALFHAAVELEGINHNRRRRSFPGQPAEQFPVDRRLDLFVFSGPQGECRGAFVRFACHAVTMTTQHVSADFPGELTRRLEEQLGGPGAPAPCLFLQGTAGDTNPTTEHQDHAAMLAFVDSMWAQLNGLVEQLQPVALNGLSVVERIFPLEFAPFPAKETLLAEIARNERILAGDQTSPDLQDLVQAYAGWRYPDDPDIHGAVAHWAGVYQEAERLTLRAVEASSLEAAGGLPGIPFRAAAIRLGPFTFVFLSGEILTSVGQRIQALAAGRAVQVISYLSPIVGYIAGPEDARLGGYEAGSAWMWYRMPGPFRADIAEDIIAHVEGLF